MSIPTPPRHRSRRTREEAMARWLTRATRAVTAVVGVLAVALIATLATRQPPAPQPGADLPNPMGGPVMAAPYATGSPATLGELEVTAPSVDMGDVPLNTTIVPRWEVSNPTAEPLSFTVGQPRVLEGCCPGPVYVGDEQVPAGGTVSVDAGSTVTVQFPLQMHPGMDGPHHLTVPLQAGPASAELHVTGNFTARA